MERQGEVMSRNLEREKVESNRAIKERELKLKEQDAGTRRDN